MYYINSKVELYEWITHGKHSVIEYAQPFAPEPSDVAYHLKPEKHMPMLWDRGPASPDLDQRVANKISQGIRVHGAGASSGGSRRLQREK